MPDETERQERLAAEIILDSEGLTDDLEDASAKPLLAWGVAQAERLAAKAAGHDLDRTVSGLRRVIKRVNNLVADRAILTGDEFAAELDELVTMTSNLTGSTVQGQVAMQSLLADRDHLDDAALVEQITALLVPSEAELTP